MKQSHKFSPSHASVSSTYVILRRLTATATKPTFYCPKKVSLAGGACALQPLGSEPYFTKKIRMPPTVSSFLEGVISALLAMIRTEIQSRSMFEGIETEKLGGEIEQLLEFLSNYREESANISL